MQGRRNYVQRSPFKLGEGSTLSTDSKQRGDGVHHALAETRIDLAAAAFDVGCGEMKRLADDDGDRTKAQPPAAARQSLVRAENSHRHDRRESFRDDKSDAGLRRLQIAVERARAFGKNERALVCAQNADERLERAAIAAFLVDRNDIQFRQKPAEHRDIEQRFAREKINRAPAADAGKRRIEIALVIHREDDRSFLDDALRMHDAKTKKDPGDQSGKMIDREIPGIHACDRQALEFQAADDFADDAIDR